MSERRHLRPVDTFAASSNAPLSRRSFLIGGGAVAGAAATLIGERAFNRLFPPTPEPEDVPTSPTIYEPIAFKYGARFRTSPQIPGKTRLYQGDNIVQWEDVITVNGKLLNAAKAFVVDRPDVVIGKPAGRVQTLFSFGEDKDFKPTFAPTNHEWLKLRILKIGDRKEIPVYVNYHGSGEFVTSLDSRTYGYDEYLSRNRILIPSSPDRIARDTIPQLWARYADDKLKKGESIYGTGIPGLIIPEASTVMSGDSTADVEKLRETGGLIRVRNFPDTRYSNREPVDIVGFLPQETKIRNLLIDANMRPNDFWGICRIGDISGGLVAEDGRRLNFNPQGVVAIHDSFLSYQIPGK